MAFAAFSLAYTPEPSRCASGPKPGAVALQTWICDHSPWADTLTNLGIYNCRTIAGSSRLSSHASGRAGDSGCPVRSGGHPAGHALAHWLVANHAILGIQEVIWNRARWTNQTRSWRPYTGPSPHLDHVHWALNTSGAAYLTTARILSVAPTSQQEDDDLTPEQAKTLAAIDLRTAGLFEAFQELKEKVDHLDPFPPESLSRAGVKDGDGVPATRLYRWTAEILTRLRDAKIGA